MKGKDRAEAGCECVREGGRRRGRYRVKECRKVMVRKDRAAFRKWGKEGWKEKVGDAEGDRKGDKTAAFLSRGAASLLGLPDLTQSRISQNGIHQ